MTPSEAVVRPYFTGGGATTRTEKEELDDLLDPYTIRDGTETWEVGGGVRLFAAGADDRSAGERIGVRLRFALGGGGLPDVRFSGMRSDASYTNRFPVSAVESFSYRAWSLGAFFSARVLPRGGFYLGPVLQSVYYEADRDWTGPTDCYQCGPAVDEATTRYGQIEGGAHYRPFAWPVRMEAFWVPGRVELSNTHKVKSTNYKANFSTFRQSIGARLSYEF